MLFCIFNGFKYKDIWIDIFFSFNKIDRVFSPYKFRIKRSKVNYILKFIIFNMLYAAIHVTELLIWEHRENLNNEYGYLLYRIVMYYHFFNTFTAMSITDALNSRYKFLRSLMTKTFAESETTVIICQDTKIISIKFTKIKQVFWLLDGIVQNYNNVFGWPVFFGTIISVIVCLADLNIMTNFANTKNSFDISVAVINALYSIIYLLSTIAIVISCDRVEKTARRIVSACYLKPGLLDRTPIRDDIIFFAEFTEKLIPSFSAAGFFQINQNILSTLFSAIITYLIIIIQFNLAL
ncbi:uncharacterized protein LOC130442002 [Diorhabda sublineata]|uniref:uncharacterized protein LOC130442002 n=1 Tax=Diorhabda sublineata TaxID=1163346 RepID=UPI0024E171C5|nr:uncharacterized protein LOC130442002 [Diorhabda sublineata]